jgi:hypothetical protein
MLPGQRGAAGVYLAYSNSAVGMNGLTTNAEATKYVLGHTGTLDLAAYEKRSKNKQKMTYDPGYASQGMVAACWLASAAQIQARQPRTRFAFRRADRTPNRHPQSMLLNQEVRSPNQEDKDLSKAANVERRWLAKQLLLLPVTLTSYLNRRDRSKSPGMGLFLMAQTRVDCWPAVLTSAINV